MKRTTVFIPEPLERDLRLCAKHEGRATAALVREALAVYVASHRAAPGLPSFVGAFASGHTDTARRHEDLVFATLTPHGGTARRRGTQRRPSRRRGR